MNLLKSEYEQLLALLHRVELKGVAEANALLGLYNKLDAKIKNWVEPPSDVK